MEGVWTLKVQRRSQIGINRRAKKVPHCVPTWVLTEHRSCHPNFLPINLSHPPAGTFFGFSSGRPDAPCPKGYRKTPRQDLPRRGQHRYT
ncbi:hypothetical protein IG631_09490 [Alternaria alternata]|nr:hypothetical protein IG631_09490 [Alternaria alternata]